MQTACALTGRVTAAMGLMMLIALSTLPTRLYAADVGSVRGVIDDMKSQPIADALVRLKSKTSDWEKTTKSGERGDFSFAIVPLGRLFFECRQGGVCIGHPSGDGGFGIFAIRSHRIAIGRGLQHGHGHRAGRNHGAQYRDSHDARQP